MGYSPFRPHMSFSGNAAAAGGIGGNSTAGASSPTTLTQQAAPSSSSTFFTDEANSDLVAELVSAVDDSFAMLLSLGASVVLFSSVIGRNEF